MIQAQHSFTASWNFKLFDTITSQESWGTIDTAGIWAISRYVTRAIISGIMHT